MDIFNGNAKLEEVIFTALDYALWSRHDIDSPFADFTGSLEYRLASERLNIGTFSYSYLDS